MEIFTLTKSKTRQKIFNLFFSHPDRDFYLRGLEKKLSLSAGNLRRELLTLVKSDLFRRYNKGRLVYYKLNIKSPLYQALKILMKKNISRNKDLISEGFSWLTKSSPAKISESVYCQTSDIFRARLEFFGNHLEKKVGTDAYLLTAIAGEIGNNSFDHNLGRWPGIPGIYFAYDEEKKIIALADRGQGIYKTISRVVPKVKDDKEALNIAFTKYISGRSPEKRGNGLKFVVENKIGRAHV